MFDFRQITLFCLEKRLSKHKMIIFSINLGGMAPLAPADYAYGRSWSLSRTFVLEAKSRDRKVSSETGLRSRRFWATWFFILICPQNLFVRWLGISYSLWHWILFCSNSCISFCWLLLATWFQRANCNLDRPSGSVDRVRAIETGMVGSPLGHTEYLNNGTYDVSRN